MHHDSHDTVECKADSQVNGRGHRVPNFPDLAAARWIKYFDQTVLIKQIKWNFRPTSQ